MRERYSDSTRMLKLSNSFGVCTLYVFLCEIHMYINNYSYFTFSHLTATTNTTYCWIYVDWPHNLLIIFWRIPYICLNESNRKDKKRLSHTHGAEIKQNTCELFKRFSCCRWWWCCFKVNASMLYRYKLTYIVFFFFFYLHLDEHFAGLSLYYANALTHTSIQANSTRSFQYHKERIKMRIRFW